jgi:hypothetical protein
VLFRDEGKKNRKSLRQYCFLCVPHKIIFGLGLKHQQNAPATRL